MCGWSWLCSFPVFRSLFSRIIPVCNLRCPATIMIVLFFLLNLFNLAVSSSLAQIAYASSAWNGSFENSFSQAILLTF
jgi:hypothetical protein